MPFDGKEFQIDIITPRGSVGNTFQRKFASQDAAIEWGERQARAIGEPWDYVRAFSVEGDAPIPPATLLQYARLQQLAEGGGKKGQMAELEIAALERAHPKITTAFKRDMLALADRLEGEARG